MAGNVSQQQSLPFLILPSLQVKKELFRGGMSAIYSLCKNPDLVLKLYARNRGGHEGTGEVQKEGGSLRLRFEKEDRPDYTSYSREVLALEALSHPNVIEARGQGIVLTEGLAIPYILLNYFKGKDLNEIIRVGEGISQMRLAMIIAQAAMGLAHVHQRGLIHKDVKPQNILVDDSNKGVVLDFGLSMPLPQEASCDDYVLGTPSYMSPEQAKGEMLDQRTDIYALGVTMFHAAVGFIPFEDGADAYRLLLNKVNNDIPDPCRLIKGFSRRLGDVIRLATQRDLRKRYFTMDDVIGDLESCMIKM